MAGVLAAGRLRVEPAELTTLRFDRKSGDRRSVDLVIILQFVRAIEISAVRRYDDIGWIGRGTGRENSLETPRVRVESIGGNPLATPLDNFAGSL